MQHFFINCIYPGIGPYVQLVSTFNDKVAEAENMGFLQNEHFVKNLDIFYVVGFYEVVDFFDDQFWTAIPYAGFSEKRIDTTKAAVKWAPQARIDHGVGMPSFDIVKTVPVMGPVFFDGKEVPGRHGKAIQILQQRSLGMGYDPAVISVPKAKDGKIISLLLQSLQELGNRVETLPLADEIDLLFSQRALG
jgi:hypothetical protein